MKHILISLTVLLAAIFASAHGEDKPGPNGGYIKMPANFHTELVPIADGTFKVYLLDIQFQNPTVEKSNIKVVAISGKNKIAVNCVPMNDHFHCTPKKSFKTGSLTIKATRNSTKASMDAKYTLPLKAFAAVESDNQKSKEEDHSKH